MVLNFIALQVSFLLLSMAATSHTLNTSENIQTNAMKCWRQYCSISDLHLPHRDSNDNDLQLRSSIDHFLISYSPLCVFVLPLGVASEFLSASCFFFKFPLSFTFNLPPNLSFIFPWLALNHILSHNFHFTSPLLLSSKYNRIHRVYIMSLLYLSLVYSLVTLHTVSTCLKPPFPHSHQDQECFPW